MFTKILGLPENQAKYRTGLWTALQGLRPQFGFATDTTPAPAPPLPKEDDLSSEERGVLAELREIVTELAAPPLGRNVFNPARLRQCEEFLWALLGNLGTPTAQRYRPAIAGSGVEVANFALEFPGRTRPQEIVVIGAHYDSVELRDDVQRRDGNCPAANDNGSGVAATIALARRYHAWIANGALPGRTVRFVLFANEEPPFFWTKDMGSVVYADACAARGEKIVAMLTPETMGYYTDEPGTQRLPFGLMRKTFGDTGNFLFMLGLGSGATSLMRECCAAFRATCSLRCIGATLPPAIPYVGASDHWSFWRHGYPALMISDGAPFRYNFYHQWKDRPEAFHWAGFARATMGLENVIRTLAGASNP